MDRPRLSKEFKSLTIFAICTMAAALLLYACNTIFHRPCLWLLLFLGYLIIADFLAFFILHNKLAPHFESFFDENWLSNTVSPEALFLVGAKEPINIQDFLNQIGYYFLLQIHIYPSRGTSHQVSRDQIHMLHTILEKNVKTAFSPLADVMMFSLGDLQYAILNIEDGDIELDDNSKVVLSDDIWQMCSQICEDLEQEYHISLLATLSPLCKSAKEFHYALETVNDLTEYSVALGQKSHVLSYYHYQNLMDNVRKSQRFALEKKFFNTLLCGQSESSTDHRL